MSNTNRLGVEQARIITISTAHLSPETRDRIEACRGDIAGGPSVAIRDSGFFVNSHLGDPDPLEQDFLPTQYKPMAERFPDLVLIRAFARGLQAEWINFDSDGVEYSDILPAYEDDGEIRIPTGEGWSEALSTIGTNYWAAPMIVADRAILEIIEAGQTPLLHDNRPGL